MNPNCYKPYNVVIQYENGPKKSLKSKWFPNHFIFDFKIMILNKTLGFYFNDFDFVI